MKKNKILIIAGLDPSGGAGLVRDLQIVYQCRGGEKPAPTVVVTALTSQSQKKFYSAGVISPRDFKNQLQAVSPLSQYAAIKIGMLGNEKLVSILVSFLKSQKKRPPIVLDPVCVSSTGGVLLTPKGRKVLLEKLVPLVSVWTPNVEEAGMFLKMVPCAYFDFGRGAVPAPWGGETPPLQTCFEHIRTPIYIKGFISGKKISDLFFDGQPTLLHYPLKNRKGIRGTGCALATLIACYLSRGLELRPSVSSARRDMQKLFSKKL